MGSQYINKRKKRIQNIINDIGKYEDKINYSKIDKLIRKKFDDDLKGYIMVESFKNIKKGEFIKYVSLDFSKIMGGVMSRIDKDSSGSVNIFTMFNPYNKKIWKIIPQQFYIYKMTEEEKASRRGGAFSAMLMDFLKRNGIDTDNLE